MSSQTDRSPQVMPGIELASTVNLVVLQYSDIKPRTADPVSSNYSFATVTNRLPLRVRVRVKLPALRIMASTTRWQSRLPNVL